MKGKCHVAYNVQSRSISKVLEKNGPLLGKPGIAQAINTSYFNNL